MLVMSAIDKLKAARNRQYLTQSDIAARAGCSITTVAKLEAGLCEYVSPRIAKKLASAYGVRIEVVPSRSRKSA